MAVLILHSVRIGLISSFLFTIVHFILNLLEVPPLVICGFKAVFIVIKLVLLLPHVNAASL